MADRLPRTLARAVKEGVASRAFPAAAVEVGRRSRPIWAEAFGSLTYEADSPPAEIDTVFDLASLTKVVATATLAMRAIDEGRLQLEDLVRDRLTEWIGGDRATVTIRDLLSHTSGLSAYLPFYRDYTGRIEFQRAICGLPLEYEPRTQAVYSDLGFILLGFILEDARERARVGAWNPADAFGAQFNRLAAFVTPEPLRFNPPRAWRERTAATEVDPWRGRLLAGEVHDENAWALGGAGGHAGLFGTAPAVGAFARAVLRTIAGEAILAQPSTMQEFIRRRDIPGSSRALGWDTMLPTSSCGTLMSRSAIGHTGFTGTSLWIDWERDVYVVLLTNRVHPTRENNAIQSIRPLLHDAVMAEIAG